MHSEETHQKKTPASLPVWILRMDLNTISQFGRPKLVGARRPVMASRSELASLIMILVASSGLIFAVRYYMSLAMSHPLPSRRSCRETTYSVDLDMVIHILRLDSQQQTPEPLERAKISADPEEVDLAKARLLLRVVHAVPDTLEDGSEGRDSNTGADQDRDLVLKHVLRRGSEWAVNIDTRKNTTNGGIDAVSARPVLVDTYNLTDVAFLVTTRLVELAA